MVHRRDGSTMKFVEHDNGLYYYDGIHHKSPPMDTNDFSFVQTVHKNKKMFSRRELEGADKARDLYIKLGRPSQAQFQHMLSHHMIPDCPVTADDAKRAITIYGPDVATLKGKTTKGKGNHRPTFKPIEIPSYIAKHHRNITICQDIFYVKAFRRPCVNL